MKKQLMYVATMGLASVLACAAWGDGIAVGYRQLGVVGVPDGAVSNVDSVVLGNQSTLYKTGGAEYLRRAARGRRARGPYPARERLARPRRHVEREGLAAADFGLARQHQVLTGKGQIR